jgi:DNA helicase IV
VISPSTNEGERRAVIDEEHAINERYLRAMADALAKQRRIAGEATRPQNEIWTNPTANQPQTPIARATIGPLVGRVAFDREVRMLAQGFYIGSWHQEWDGVQVVSWAAPVASLFYQGRRAIDAAANSVVGRRTFVIDHSDIVNYVDDLENEGRNRDDPFSISLSRKLNVPPPPAPASPLLGDR